MIGILDSGLGSLYMIKPLTARFPAYDFVYFADTARGPLGEKSLETIRNITFEGLSFLRNKGAKLIVLASHSMACALYNHGEEDFSNDVFNPIAQLAKTAIKESKHGRIGILGDTAVVTSGVFQDIIQYFSPETKAFSQASPLLSHLIKEGLETKPEAIRILKKYLSPLKMKQVDSLILGASWYYSIHNVIGNKAGRKIRIVDSAKILTDSMMLLLKRHPEFEQILEKTGKFQCYVTDITEKTPILAKRMYRGNISLLRA